MTRIATVNYHVHKPERQAFVLDADGIAGNLISPELAPTAITLQDMRGASTPVRFASDGVEFAHVPTQVQDFHSDGWTDLYDAELSRMLELRLGVREVVVFDHTVRVDDPKAQRKPARNVHSDYSTDGAEQRLEDLLGPNEPQNSGKAIMRSSMCGGQWGIRSTPPLWALCARHRLHRRTGLRSTSSIQTASAKLWASRIIPDTNGSTDR